MADGDNEINYRFDCSALGSTIPPLRAVRLVEALNLPYTLRVDAILMDPNLDSRELVGQDCALVMYRSGNTERRVCGVIHDIRDAGDGSGQCTVLTIRPALQMLELRRDTRIFQNMSAPEILEDVLGGALGDYGRSVTLDLERSYPTREYCVQYQETDLDFVHRLMEEEGISYAFDHEGDVEDMVLRDRNASFGDVPSGRVIDYAPNNAEIVNKEPVVLFGRDHRPTRTAVTTRDWDWTRGGNMVVTANAPGEDRDGRVRESYEHGRGRSLTLWSYEQGVRRYQQEDSAGVTPTRLQEHGHDSLVGHGVTRVVSMAPGLVFELNGHDALGFDDTYLVTRVEHVSQPIGHSTGGDGPTDPYHNRIEVIPLATEFRPRRRTEKPLIPSIQTAVVTGPGGEEIHVDEHGRIKVQFHWDRVGQNDEDSSCWVRVQQPWAGAGWGFWWVPRIGMEVVVHFIDGDPDRPLVTASVYDGANPTPYGLPDEKTKSTIKSNSSLGGGGSNEFRFEDLKGEEEIYTHAEKDYNEVVENDHNTLVHHDQTNEVDNNQTQIVHVDQTETVDNDQMMTVDGNRTVHVKSNFEELVDGTETRLTTGDVTESFDSNEARTIGASVTETVSGNESRTIAGSQDESVTGSYSQSVTGSATELIMGSLTENVIGGITTTTPAAYNVTAVGGWSVTAAGGITINAPAGLTIASPGGVTQVDDFYEWMGSLMISVGALKHEICGLKIESTLTQFSFTGVAYEDTACEFANEEIELKAIGNYLKTKAIDMKNGAVKFVPKAFGIKS